MVINGHTCGWTSVPVMVHAIVCSLETTTAHILQLISHMCLFYKARGC